MKGKKIIVVFLIGTPICLFLIWGHGFLRAEMSDRDLTDDTISETSEEKRLEDLRNLRTGVLRDAKKRVLQGEYSEGVTIAKEAVAKLRDSDYEKFPAMAAHFHYVVGAIADMARAELWKEATRAYLKNVEIAAPHEEASGIASLASQSLAELSRSVGALEEAEEYYVKAIKFADSIPRKDDSVSLVGIDARKEFLIFCMEHGKRRKARELIEELQEIVETKYPLSDEEMAKFGDEKAKQLIEYNQRQKEELKGLLEDVQKKIQEEN